MEVQYRVHVKDQVWHDWVADGAVSGNTDQGARRVESLEVRLTGGQPWSVVYRGHVKDQGWQAWAPDGVTAGTTARDCSSKRCRCFSPAGLSGNTT